MKIENIRPRPTKEYRAKMQDKGYLSWVFWLTLEWRPNEDNEDLPDFGRVVFTQVPLWFDEHEARRGEYHSIFAENLILLDKQPGLYKIWFYTESCEDYGDAVLTDILRLSDLPPGSAARESVYAETYIFEAKKDESDLPF